MHTRLQWRVIMEYQAPAGQLFVGWSMKEITPKIPVALVGQFYNRIAHEVRDPLTATALALETRNGDKSADQCIIISCDLLAVDRILQEKLRHMLSGRIPDFSGEKLILCATHIHTGPFVLVDVLSRFWGESFMYGETDHRVTSPEEYMVHLLESLCEAAAEAWMNRSPGGVSTGDGYAAIGFNRRVVYTDGTTVMYGNTNSATFNTLEGPEDHGIELLFFWDGQKSLTGIGINVACPSQVLEHKSYISADYWGEVRKELRRRYGSGVFLLPLPGAAGDQSPRDLIRLARSETEMHLEDMYNEEGIRLIAEKMADTVDRCLPEAAGQIKTEIKLKHTVKEVALPLRRVSMEEASKAEAEYNRLVQLYGGNPDLTEPQLAQLSYLAGTKNRLKLQEEMPFYNMELHVVRIHESVIVTNPFELFMDFSLRMKARSKAIRTFVTQLACDYGGYLPTSRAVLGGGYSAMVSNGYVGPDGGQLLVDMTVEAIHGLWEDETNEG